MKRHLRFRKGKQATGEDWYPVIIDKGGYRHRRCPVTVANAEIQNIISDTLFCISTEQLPNAGSLMDQSAIFRLAYTIIKSERELIKNEREKKAASDSGKGGKGKAPRSGRRRGR